MITIESKLVNELNAAKSELERWLSKEHNFWQKWQGDSKPSIIKRCEQRVNVAAQNLNAYYVKIGSDKVA